MEKFAYANPATLKEAAGLLNADAAVLAGGTDLLSMMKEGLAAPKVLVNVKNIHDLGGITVAKNSVRIGAAVTLDELSEHPAIRKNYPALAEAAAGITSPQIRNMGTVGGDLLQRPRCWYFRQGYGLLATAADGKSLVPEGENRYHAILGNGGPAYFVSASSFGPALMALGASVRLVSAAGSRDLPVEQLFVTPQSDGMRETAIKPDEILSEIHVPLAPSIRSATYELRQREAIDWPLATASVALKMSGGKVESSKIVLGHVAPTPWPVPAADAYLQGKAITEETATEAGKLALQGATPLSQNAYKVQLARVAVKRALLAAAQGA